MADEVVMLFKGLADKSRLRILKSLIKEDMYVERLAKRLGVSPPTISFHLKKLEEAGLVKSRKEQYYTVYSLRRDTLTHNILDLLSGDMQDDDLQDQRDEIYKQNVLAAFMEHGKLTAIPAQLKKRKIILEEIGKSFAENREYTEKEVNIIIADFHDDFCTIRRDMIGFGLLQRQNDIYSKPSHLQTEASSACV